MQKQISSKAVVLTFGVLVTLFALGFYIFAWQEPGAAPPAGNVAAPLNTSATAQTKTGNLTINGVLTTLQNLIVNTLTIKGDGTISTNLNSDKVDSYHAADLMAAGGGGGGALITWGAGTGGAGVGAPACPSGWTEAYSGYGPYAFMYNKEYNYGGTGYGYGYAAVSTNCGASVQLYSPSGAASWCACLNCYNGNACNTCRVCVK
jgi:hypothetical protein